MTSQTDLSSRVSDFELGWLIGILEGEGTFIYNKHTHRVTVAMSDRDTILRVINVMSRLLNDKVSYGEIPPTNPDHSLIYTANISGERARSIMRFVVSHMSQRRRKKIWQCLNKFTYKNIKLDLYELGIFKRSA